LHDAVTDWKKGKNTNLWSPRLYADRLAYDQDRVETDIALFEMHETKNQK